MFFSFDEFKIGPRRFYSLPPSNLNRTWLKLKNSTFSACDAFQINLQFSSLLGGLLFFFVQRRRDLRAAGRRKGKNPPENPSGQAPTPLKRRSHTA